ncbi:MAG TPA: hypothetical protein H9955_05435 [Candidatus Mediterraneibacter cottocaccae]|nr:hypothetical protein [Candidatus Mediterraneibacter cottocaccae]
MEKYGRIPEEFLPVMKAAQACIDDAGEERPEVVWLKERFDNIRKKYFLRTRMEADRFVFERMYGCPPQTDTDCLKIRYWRTGKYTPINREQCRMLGEALELSGEEMLFLFQGYYDRSATVYMEGEDSEEYREKCRRMEGLIRRYLAHIPEETLNRLKIAPSERDHYFRHLYFTDAFRYVCEPVRENTAALKKHITSTRYDSEIRRQMKLLGEIPRRTMIRHLIILGAPGLTLDWMNRQLKAFGYLPLREEHTMTGGERLDRLLISILAEYEKTRAGKTNEENRIWLRRSCRILDDFYKKKKYRRMRFMHFKSLEI